jgi:serine/threonine protein kinase
VSTRPLELTVGTEPYPGYRLERELGRGAWSVVWEARRADGSPCALKFMDCRQDLAPAQELRALQAVRQLRHPHLLGVENVWCCPGYLVIAMEIMDGSLLDLLGVYLHELDQPMSAEHVAFFLSQAADAIDFLNARQHTINGQRVAFRHCDIKPNNLLVRGNMVKLADFSLAFPTASTMAPYRPCGTLVYGAPEVFQGFLSDRTDQYSLAISYYQLRTGRLPFHDTPASFTRSYVRPAPDLSYVTPAERDALSRALSPVPQNRWPTCREMMRQLSACCRPEPMAV